jgi:lipooligosaccharide transport system permease protein
MMQMLALWRPPLISPRAALRIWQRNLLLYRRSWLMNILPNFFSPLLYLVSIGVGVGVYIGTRIAGIDYVLFLAPALAANAAMNGGVFETTYNVFVKMRFAHLYDAIITTPLEAEDVAAGELAWGTTRAMFYGLAFLAIMLVFGFIRSPMAILTPVEFALLGLVFALIGMIFTALSPSIDYFSYFFTLFVTPLFLFSGTFFPISNLPVPLQGLAWFSPLYHGSEALRDLALRGDIGDAAGHSLWLLVACLLLLPPAINLMRRKLIV